MNSEDQGFEFNVEYRRIHHRLFAYVNSMVLDLNDTDEIVQRAAIVMWEKSEQFDAELSFFSWACGIARFELLNFIRKKGRDKLSFSSEIAELLATTFEERDANLSEHEQALSNCLERLPESDRNLIESCYLDENGIAMMAKSMNRSTQSIYNSLRRIRKVLYQCVKRISGMQG